MLSLEKATDLLNALLKNEALKKHCLASAAIMKSLAKKFGEPAEEWEIIGLLHDLDFEETREMPEKHGRRTVEILEKHDMPVEYLQAILSHNEANGSVRQSRLDHALAAAESMTGLVVACALVYPDRRIASVKPKSITKRMKEKAFARNVSRENIMECEKAGIGFDDFVQLSIEALIPIQDQLIG